MNRIIIVMLFLCIGFIGSGCYKKNYSVEEFKKDKKLLSE
ncbi:EexN family lipoprotein [Bartonella silvatica]